MHDGNEMEGVKNEGQHDVIHIHILEQQFIKVL